VKKQDQRVKDQGVVNRNQAPTPVTVPSGAIKNPVTGGSDNVRGAGDSSVINRDSDSAQLRGNDNPQAGDGTGTKPGGFGTPGKPMNRGTSGKAVGSGKWGYVGDIAVGEPGNPDLDVPHLYGLDINEETNQLVVTSNGKCRNFFGMWCFGDAATKKYDLTTTPRDTAQYEGNGYYGATLDDQSDGVGASFDNGESGVALKLPPGKEWYTPRGVYVDPETGEIYVTDSNGGTNQTVGEIRKFDKDGNFLMAFGDSKDKSIRLENPYGLAGYTNPATGVKEIYTISYQDRAVRVYDSNGTYLRSFATVQAPWGLDIDEKTGDVYIATHQYQRAIRVYSNDGTVKGDIVIPTEIAQSLDQTKVDPSDSDDAFRARGHAMGVKIDQDTGLVMVWDQNGFDTDSYKKITSTDVVNYQDKGGRVWFFRVGEFNKESREHPEKNPIPVDVLQLDQAQPGSLWNGSMGKQAPRGVVMDDLGLIYATTQQWDGTDQDPKLESRIQIYGKTPDAVTGAQATMFTAVTTRDKTVDEAEDPITKIYAPGTQIDEATPVAVIRWKNADRGFHQSAQMDTVIEVSYDDGKTWTQYDSAATGTNGEENVAYVAVPDAQRNKTYYFRLTPFNEAGSGDAVIAAASLPDATMKIDKSAELTGDRNGNGLVDAGETVTYTITVTAESDAVANVEITDPMLANDTLKCNRKDVLNVISGDEKLTCTADHVVTKADIEAATVNPDQTRDVVNTATAEGWDPVIPSTTLAPVSASATVTATTNPGHPIPDPVPADDHAHRPTPGPTPHGGPGEPTGPVIVIPPSAEAPTVEPAGQTVTTTAAEAERIAPPTPSDVPTPAAARPSTQPGRLANTGPSTVAEMAASAILLLLAGSLILASRRRES